MQQMSFFKVTNFKFKFKFYLKDQFNITGRRIGSGIISIHRSSEPTKLQATGGLCLCRKEQTVTVWCRGIRQNWF